MYQMQNILKVKNLYNLQNVISLLYPQPPRGLLAFPLVFSVLHSFLFGRSPLKNLCFVYSMVCYMHINIYKRLNIKHINH